MCQDPIADAMTDKLIDGDVERLSSTFASKHERMAQMTEVLRAAVEHARAKGLESHAVLWNVALFINIAAHDLSLLVLDLAIQRDPWKRRFTARHLALLLYEATEDIQSLLGKSFREALDRLTLLAKFEARLNATRAPLNTFWTTHQSALKQIRIASVAHRDHDAIATMKVIDSLQPHEMLTLGVAFGQVLNVLGPMTQAILTESSNILSTAKP